MLLLLFAFLFACKGREKEKDTVVVQSLLPRGELVTVEYTLSKIVKANDNKTWYKPGDRKILMSVQAVVKAGVDLTQVKKEDIEVGDSSIRLRLPPPKLFSLSIPPDKISVQYESVTLFRSRFSAAEREALLAQAEQSIRRVVDSLGVLQTARVNTIAFFEHLLRPKGFNDVQVEFTR